MSGEGRARPAEQAGHEPSREASRPFGDHPSRIQLRRTKGWRMPPNTVKVDRTTRWGNPFSSSAYSQDDKVRLFRIAASGAMPIDFAAKLVRVPAILDLANAQVERVAALPFSDLRGKNLACWCPPDAPCHADVLLELANADSTTLEKE